MARLELEAAIPTGWGVKARFCCERTQALVCAGIIRGPLTVEGSYGLELHVGERPISDGMDFAAVANDERSLWNSRMMRRTHCGWGSTELP